MRDMTRFANDPLITALSAATPVCWHNPHLASFANARADIPVTDEEVSAAHALLQRFAPYLAQVFPQTAPAGGLIESPLHAIPNLQAALNLPFASGSRLYLKADNELPVSGSIKARGGIYEVLQHAEALALQHGLLQDKNDDHRKLATSKARALFASHAIAVGSTGNLGLSIGIMAAQLGFRVTVHMSADARAWKKDKLRAHGVSVMEYQADYGVAVAAGREQAVADPRTHFVDDENSRQLFLGYATAGARVKSQLEQAGVSVDAKHPLIVYLPCGVGGGPGGVAFGLKLAYGDAVHCVFAEPVQSPCMLLGIYTGLHDTISVQDIGLTNRTAADGLAVGHPSGFIGRALMRCLHALYTVRDDELFRLLALAYQHENLKLEPSAAAGLAGLPHFAHLDNATHLVWATGGSMVPDNIFAQYLRQSALPPHKHDKFSHY
ncbi:MAG: D-serine ammonia-lyase [Cardiobacteriaceae bacterium]|nr:D-serine ammonia-lyase [Cardiobacteriaceae bacterium]